ncbi:MAG: 3-methyl-2-oxobutanoate hydroxymethyltransferase [Spirochaetia bacterium]|nr:3-methyl-2-oxobutanoate hydroxymethyltransferase [Spirochaetia bacterium]
MEKKKLKYPSDWIQRKQSGIPISVITAYDASMARLAEHTSVDAILTGDSLSMVVQGNQSTLPVTLDEMIYHSRLVRQGAPDRFLIGDLPFGSYQESEEKALHNSFRMMKESRTDAVKMEGCDLTTLKIIEKLVRSGVPVMGHIGLLPQSYLSQGGYRVHGKSESDAKILMQSAKDLESAGVFSMIMEYITETAAREITDSLTVPTIGIGSGKFTSGQVLVWHDALGMETDFKPRHAKRYANLDKIIVDALNEFDREVKDRNFPGKENSF